MFVRKEVVNLLESEYNNTLAQNPGSSSKRCGKFSNKTQETRKVKTSDNEPYQPVVRREVGKPQAYLESLTEDSLQNSRGHGVNQGCKSRGDGSIHPPHIFTRGR